MLGHVNALGGGQRRLRGPPPAHPGHRDQRAPGRRQHRHRSRWTAAPSYSKDNFPTLEVYGNTAGPELRLITCDGYDPATGLFDDNYVVYAKLKT